MKVPRHTLDATRKAAAHCHDCPLWEHATQTVFGEGPDKAGLMLVGEVPGDKEDLAGHPFVGPAGALLDRALTAAGVSRSTVYVTNAVKHFKWEPRGKRRLHKTPAQAEVAACHQWLKRELELVGPRLIIALGATAARALLGPGTTVESNRGKTLHLDDGTPVRITMHPSAVLRVPREAHAEAYARFLADIKAAVRLLDKPGGA